jgi:hypothetical protein
MTRVLPRTNFHSSQLIRCLAELNLLEGAEPAGDFADDLGQWLHFTDAITLSTVLDSGMANMPAQSPVLHQATGVRLGAEFERTRTLMLNSITKSCAGGTTAIKLPLPPDLEARYSPYRRFYEAHQRDMALSVEPLRVKLRNALASASPSLRKLAELDVMMDKFLRERENRLMARVPLLLQKRFDALYAVHQDRLAVSGQPDSQAEWIHPGGWLTRFCQTLQTLLLAEAELRLQPSAGLLDAFNQQRAHE